eukprot:gnl/TRDRNA2_/TRDRNA2_177062_c8_seq30.p1 gnl/TRDRNA2_/TRDRNA2_177062_c8~~gnl/TRDRNA2_/TRDRNA2_177062_c8_seq30.p1  ORF type:complete len:206 (+),score=34.24 gnl/TRDRNA2_/TRDRNA2_177062_c8_seq30:62-679(+)
MAAAQSSHDMWRGRDRQPESSSISDRRPTKAVAHQRDHGPGAGHVVRVFSRSAEAWVEGEVVEIMKDNHVRVEYELAEGWHRKMLHLQSENLAKTNTNIQFPDRADMEAHVDGQDVKDALKQEKQQQQAGSQPLSEFELEDEEPAATDRRSRSLPRRENMHRGFHMLGPSEGSGGLVCSPSRQRDFPPCKSSSLRPFSSQKHYTD